MSEFTFRAGTWSEGTNLPKWNEEEDFIDYLHRVGFSTVETSYGNEYGGHVEIYEAHGGDSFFATVCPTGNFVYSVHLPDFVSYMLFMKDFAAPFAAGATAEIQRDTHELLGKFFRAEHGHSADEVCERCAPEEVKRRKEAHRKFAASQG